MNTGNGGSNNGGNNNGRNGNLPKELTVSLDVQHTPTSKPNVTPTSKPNVTPTNKTNVTPTGQHTTYSRQNLSSSRQNLSSSRQRISSRQRLSGSTTVPTDIAIGSLGIKKFLLSLKGRLSASAYVVSLGGLIVLTAMSYYILLPMCMFLPGFIKVLAMIGYILLLTWIGIAITVRRLHDLGHNGWWFLISLIPFLNVLLIIYLGFWKGEAGENLYGAPTSPAPLPFAILCYPIFALTMFLNLLPAASIIPGIDKLPGVGYLVPSSEVTDAKDVQQFVDAMPGIVRDNIDKQSIALVLSQGQMVAAGGFITENRILISSPHRASAIQDGLAQQQDLQVKSLDKTGNLTRLVASSPARQWYVFEVDQPIGKPGFLRDENRNALTAIGAFK